MNDEVKEILDDCTVSMEKALDAFRRELARVRTGCANTTVLDGIRVEYYGSLTPLNQVAALTVADPRLITVKPWDKNLLSHTGMKGRDARASSHDVLTCRLA